MSVIQPTGFASAHSHVLDLLQTQVYMSQSLKAMH